MRGRKRKPTELKIANGSAAHDPQRLNPFEPKVDRGRADMPDWLSEYAREGWEYFWSALEGLGIESPVYLTSALTFADNWAEFREHSGKPAIDEKGRRSASSVIARQAKDAAFKMLSEFGMTASSKSRVSAAGETEQDAFGQYQQKRRSGA